MSKIFVTRKIPEAGLDLLRQKGHEVDVSPKDGVLTKAELIQVLSAKPYDAILSLLTDKIDAEVLAAVPNVKVIANYAVGYDNLDLAAAKERGIIIANTPNVLNNSVAEHAVALMIAAAKRIVEADRFTRTGQYQGWAPDLLLGTELAGKTLAIVGLGRIGARVAEICRSGFGMMVLYYDVNRNEEFEQRVGAEFRTDLPSLLPEADFVSVHVPLLPATKHLINAEMLKLMKRSAVLVNTSRGPVVDETALVEALKNKVIRAAGLDVFENEPALAPGLAELENVILTPHTASATDEARTAMSLLAAQAIVDVAEGREPANIVKT